MKFDIVRLNNNIDKSINVALVYNFSEEELKGTDIIRLNGVKIKGEIYKNSLNNIELSLNVDGIMVLPCAITLKEVDYPFNIQIDGELNELSENLEENSINFQNTIDIFPIIWENILMEIPMRVISDDIDESEIVKRGDGWEFITGDENKESPLSGLMELIDDSEVR